MEEIHTPLEGIQGHHDIYYIYRQEPNYASPTKRSFLGECITQIHIMNGNIRPMVSLPIEYNKNVIWHRLNNIMRPLKLTNRQIRVEKVRRRLFQEPKEHVRKTKTPQRNNSKLSEGAYFKTFRDIASPKKIRRNYLAQAQLQIKDDLRQKLKRKHSEHEEGTEFDHHKKATWNISQQLHCEACHHYNNIPRYQPQTDHTTEERIKRERNNEAWRYLGGRVKRLKEMVIEQRYGELSIANDKVWEASARSILYINTLMKLTTGH